MSSFSNERVFGLNWAESKREKLSASEVASIAKTEVVQRTYGLAAVFFLKTGGHVDYILSNQCTKAFKVGDTLDPAAGSIVTLSRKGDDDIKRWEE